MDDHRCGCGGRSLGGDRAQPPGQRAQRHLGSHLRALTASLLFCLTGCSSPPSILLRLSSDLLIPTEADTLVVSVYAGSEAVRQESYLLGSPPRDRWPQTLPLLSEGRLATVGVGAELRRTAQGGAPRIVGYGSLEVSFPSSGNKEVELTIARSCSGAPAPGCPERPDAGPLDVACPGGCGDAEVCFQSHCRPYCDVMTPCTDQNQIICEDPGVCTCTLPCQDGGCFPHACLPNGCCKLQ